VLFTLRTVVVMVTIKDSGNEFHATKRISVTGGRGPGTHGSDVAMSGCGKRAMRSAFCSMIDRAARARAFAQVVARHEYDSPPAPSPLWFAGDTS